MDKSTHFLTSERKAKYMTERIGHIQNTFEYLFKTLSSMNRKNAKLRDRGDELASLLMTYADSESVNRCVKKALQNLSSNLAVVQSFQDAKVKCMDERVLKPISDYDRKCKLNKKNVHSYFILHKRELKQFNQVQKLRLSGNTNSLKFTTAENNWKRAQVDAFQSTISLEKDIKDFERQKIIDIKKYLSEFVHLEMVYHAKAMENLAKGFEYLHSIDIDEDLESFDNAMKDFNITRDSEESSQNLDTPDLSQDLYLANRVSDVNNTITKQYTDAMYEEDLSDYDEDEDDDDDERSPSTQ